MISGESLDITSDNEYMFIGHIFDGFFDDETGPIQWWFPSLQKRKGSPAPAPATEGAAAPPAAKDVKEGMKIPIRAARKTAQATAICADCPKKLTAPFQKSLFSTPGCVVYCCPKCIREEVEEDERTRWAAEQYEREERQPDNIIYLGN